MVSNINLPSLAVHESVQAHPIQARLERIVEKASLIFRIAVAVFIDLLLFPIAGALLIASHCKVNFNPKPDEIKEGKTPILLLHGSGFNESEWVVGRQFLKKDHYGSVFSMNYDGLASNDPTKGIEDYAREKISAEVRRIKNLTGSDKIILMGHSMGGLIAGYYAQHCAAADAVNVEHVFSIATPWRGSPTIELFWKLGGPYAKEKETKRHLQMSVTGGTTEDPQFRQRLVAAAQESDRQGIRKYYNIWSSTDYAVPGECGLLTEDTRRQRSFNFLGHNSIVAWPQTWNHICTWLDEICLEA